jgi:hypothetical protein
MEHGVGRAAERDDHGDGVFEGLAGHDVERADAEAEQAMHGCARAQGVVLLFRRDGVLGGAVGEAHAERLDRAGHGVGRVHTAAGTGAGDGHGLERGKRAVAHFTL